MAYVEEVIPEGGLESPLEHTLFIVPDNWNPHPNFGPDSKPPPTSTHLGPHATSSEMPYCPYYVEDEVPPEPTREAEVQAHT